MKVLQINSVCGIGSTGRICTDLASYLEKEGHECKIAYGRESVPEFAKKYAVRIGTDLDVKLHGAITRAFDMHGFGSKRATERFIEWVKVYDPDIIHLHNIHGYYINIEVLFHYLKNSGKPVIWTLHDCWAFTGHCTHFDYIGCEKWRNGCKDCVQSREYPASVGCDKSKFNYAAKKQLFTSLKSMKIVVPSKWLESKVKQSFFVNYNTAVLLNGIDTRKFKPTKSHLREQYHLKGKKVILAVASVWGEKKGLGIVQKLSRMLDAEYKVVVIGISEKQRRSLPINILTIPRTDSVTELAQWYTTADIFINPTLEEVFGLTNLESQACQTPAVVFNTGGCPETVHPLAGTVVAKGDVDAMKDCIESLCGPKTVYRKWILENFNKEICCAKYMKLYQGSVDWHDEHTISNKYSVAISGGVF